jgi:hypothetical protein
MKAGWRGVCECNDDDKEGIWMDGDWVDVGSVSMGDEEEREVVEFVRVGIG